MSTFDSTELNSNQTKRYNEIFEEIADEYSAFVDKICAGKRNNIYWWCTTFASRNINLSSALSKIALVLLIIEIVENDENIDKIVVYSYSVKRVLCKYLEQKEKKYLIQLKGKRHCFYVGSAIKRIIKFSKVHFHIGKIVKKYYKQNKGIDSSESSNAWTMIQTDVFSSCFSTGRYVARDFIGVEKYTFRNIKVFPYLFINNEWSMEQLVKACIADETDFVFRERYLSFLDYIKLFLMIPYCLYSMCNKAFFKGQDVSPIVNDDIKESMLSANSYYGIIDYFATKRMKQVGILPNKIIGWYEGQPSSIGFFMGIHNFLYGIRTVGYIGYPIDKKLIQFAPTIEQIKQRAAPDQTTVIGECFKKNINRYVKDYPVVVAPGFRLQGMYAGQEESSTTDSILVILPYSVSGAGYVLDLINDADLLSGETLVIRNHPANHGFKLSDYQIKNAFKHPYIMDNQMAFSDAIHSSRFVIIYGETTSGLEIVLSGKKVICIMPLNGIALTGIPEEIKNISCYEVYGKQDLTNALINIKNNELEKKYINKEFFSVKASTSNVESLIC